MQEQQKQSPGGDARTGIIILVLFINALAMGVIPIIRHSFGKNVPGNTGVVTVVLMFLSIGITRDAGMLCFMSAWVCAVICQRVRAFYLCRRGWRLHSEYRGVPWTSFCFPFIRTEKAALDFEPVLCFAFGCLLSPISMGVGEFVASSAIALFLVRLIDQAICSRQVTAISDLQIEQRALSERVRGMRHGF